MNLKLTLKNIFNIYIRASLHVAFALTAFAYLSLSELKVVPQKNFFPFVFMSVLVGYNVLKYFHLSRKDITFLKKNPIMWIITLIATVFGLIFFFGFTLEYQIYGLLFSFLTLAYLYFRKWALLKIFYVSFIIVAFTSFVPIISQYIFDSSYIYHALTWFFVIAAWMIPFEIIDSSKDHLLHKTIPQKIGLLNAKRLGYLFLILVAFIQYYFLELDFTKIFIFLISTLAIYFASPNRNFYYTAFWVEAIPLVWWAIEMT